MDSNKKTALDDDALMYKKHSDRVTKDQIKSLSKKDKWQYFKDYYLKFVVIGIVAVIFIGYMLMTTVFSDVTTELTVGVLSETTYVNSELLIEELTEHFEFNSDKEKIYVNTFNKQDSASQMAAFTQIGAGSIDVILVDSGDFELYANQGALVDLSEIFTEEELSKYNDLIVMEKFKQTDYDGNVISEEEAKPYGLKITGDINNDSIVVSDSGVYIAIMAGNEHMENAKECVEYIINNLK